MGCPSCIYAVITNATVAADAQGPFGSVVRRYGPCLRLDGSGINMIGSGYYSLDASLTFTPTGAGSVTIQFYQDGQAVTGALATAQGAAGEPVTLPVTAELRNCGCGCNTVLTYTISAAGVIDNLAVRVKRD